MTASPASTRFGLPDGVDACLFDLDGVLTRTATVHAAAWKEMFDAFLRTWSQDHGEAFVPFDAHHDYAVYVDGMPRADGTRGFLAARGIALPEGLPADPPGTPTVAGLGNLKNEIVARRIHDDGVAVYAGSVEYVRRVRAGGLRTAVVSSSANTAAVLRVTGIEDLFDARIDAGVARERTLRGKPAPDTFLAGAAALDVPARRAAVFEDALAGVEAGRAGGFAVVVGVDRSDGSDGSDSARAGSEHADALRAHGADLVVADLADLLPR